MPSSRSSLVVFAIIGLAITAGCEASSSTTSQQDAMSTRTSQHGPASDRFESVVAAVDRVYIAPDRRTVVVYAGTPRDACQSGDDGATATVRDDALIVEARRLVPDVPPPTCLDMCTVTKSTVSLPEPLAESVTVALSATGASATCSSVLDPAEEIPIEPCRHSDPTPIGEAVTTTRPDNSDPVLLVSC